MHVLRVLARAILPWRKKKKNISVTFYLLLLFQIPMATQTVAENSLQFFCFYLLMLPQSARVAKNILKMKFFYRFVIQGYARIFLRFASNVDFLCLKCKLLQTLLLYTQFYKLITFGNCCLFGIHSLIMFFFFFCCCKSRFGFKFLFMLLHLLPLNIKDKSTKKNKKKAFINMDILYEQMYVCMYEHMQQYVHIYVSFYL